MATVLLPGLRIVGEGALEIAFALPVIPAMGPS